MAWRSGRQCRLDLWRISCLLLSAATSVEEVNRVFTEEAASDRYRQVLAVTKEPIVSSDIIQQSYASIVDLSLTQVVDQDVVKIMSWYDNEWGDANQMVRQALDSVLSGCGLYLPSFASRYRFSATALLCSASWEL